MVNVNHKIQTNSTADVKRGGFTILIANTGFLDISLQKNIIYSQFNRVLTGRQISVCAIISYDFIHWYLAH